MRRAALALLLASAVPALGAEGGEVRGGEHADFSRVVMVIEPTTEWSLQAEGTRAVLHFPGRRLDFDTGGVFDRMPQTRIRAISAVADARGTTVTVDLACACRVSASFVGAQYLALDVGAKSALEPVTVRQSAPPAETAAARATREAAAVATAEQILIRQIQRAAGQGLVEMSAPPPDDPVTMPAPKPRRREALEQISLFTDHDQIEATTVFDRDTRAARAAAAIPEPAEACIDDATLSVEDWAEPRPMAEQAAALRGRLVGEFDAPDPQAVSGLARLYIRFGLGAEAASLLGALGGLDPAEAALLDDMAAIVDGRPAGEGGPLAYAGACPGRFALWLALGGRAPLVADPSGFAAVGEAFEALPPDLRRLLGPGLTGRLFDGDHPVEAQLVMDVTLRAGGEPTPAMRLVAARLRAAQGDAPGALSALAALSETGDPIATDALVQMVRIGLDARLPVPDRVLLDLRAAAFSARGAPREVGLRMLLAAALAGRNELPAAFAEIRSAMHDLPEAGPDLAMLALESLAAAEPDKIGQAAYAATALEAADLIGATPPRDPVRRAVARNLVALGLPDSALAVLAPAIAADDPAARLIAAEAELKRGGAKAAEATVGTIGGAEAAEIRARALAADGDHAGAVRALAEAGLDPAAYVWPGGDWQEARVTDDARRRALADYMAARAGAPASLPDGDAPDPAAAAFAAPLPNLSRPSLGAARTLLANGTEVHGVVADVLGPPADAN